MTWNGNRDLLQLCWIGMNYEWLACYLSFFSSLVNVLISIIGFAQANLKFSCLYFIRFELSFFGKKLLFNLNPGIRIWWLGRNELKWWIIEFFDKFKSNFNHFRIFQHILEQVWVHHARMVYAMSINHETVLFTPAFFNTVILLFTV